MDRLKIEFYPYNLQLKYPFAIANYTRTTTPVVLLKMSYGEFSGYGEASLPQYLGETQESVCKFLRKIKLDSFSDPLKLDEILDYIGNLDTDNMAAKACFDIALHDLTGKIQDKSWYSIWNFDKENTPYTTYTIGIDSDDVVRKKTEEVAADFKILKVKLGSENDKKLIKVIRSVTDLPISVDANQGWKDKEEALDTICWLAEEGCVMIEQPMNKSDLDGNAWLTENSSLPIFADESFQVYADVERLKGVFSGINVKLMKCGGMYEAHRILKKAQEMEFKTMLGCMTETSCAISAAAQLSPMVDFADLDGNLLITNDCFNGVKVMDGKIILNDFSGIGVLPKEDTLFN